MLGGGLSLNRVQHYLPNPNHQLRKRTTTSSTSSGQREYPGHRGQVQGLALENQVPYPVILGLYWHNGKENGNYYNGLYRVLRCSGLHIPYSYIPTTIWVAGSPRVK